jgi:hypothetical protein
MLLRGQQMNHKEFCLLGYNALSGKVNLLSAGSFAWLTVQPLM